MRQYELMIILDPELEERTVQPSLDKFLSVVTKDGGTVDKVDIWGRRRLAYEIKKKSEGIYAVVNMTRGVGHRQGAGPPARSQRVGPADQAPASRRLSSPLPLRHRPDEKQGVDMAGDTIITIIGNLTGDPELRFTPSGAAVANFTVASTPRQFDRQSNEWKDGETLFMRCSVWRDAAENVAESLTRGTRVIVSGRLKSRSYETKEGEKRTVVEMEVDEVGPSLRYATAKVNRTQRGGGGGGWRRLGGQGGGSGGGFGGQQGGGSTDSDPWATGRQRVAPAARRRAAGQQGGWGNSPSYDEPPF